MERSPFFLCILSLLWPSDPFTADFADDRGSDWTIRVIRGASETANHRPRNTRNTQKGSAYRMVPTFRVDSVFCGHLRAFSVDFADERG
jgi:hypothetical protein